VECVVEDSKGRVWIGTEDGLNLFDEQTHDFTRFGEKDGLPSAVVLGILEDAGGNLWLSTNHGLCRFHPETKTFRNYDESDGLHGNTFNSHAYCRTADGRLWFGGVGGFTVFHPDSVRDNAVPPPVVLTEFRKFNKPVRLDSAINYQTSVQLDYTENFITIGFAALNFTHPEKNRYKYKLEGFDHEWIDADTKHEASYTNLDGGDYVFRVIASNNDGIWNMEGARLHIIVTPPFWKTKWFLFFGLATIISATAGGMSVWNKERLRKQRQHYELETIQQQAEYQRQLEITRIQSEAQAHERERIFRDIHDGLGAQIVEIAAMTEQLKSELPPPEEFLTESIQNEWVQAIMLSVYELRGSLREIVWLLNMENDSLEALIAYLRQETTRMLENASLNVSFSIDHTLPNDVNVHPDVRRNVVMAVREACANIVKHAGASAVEIDTHLADGTLTLTLRDNGFGFVPENVRRFSNGMKIMQKRMALCGGSMTLDSAPNAGTTIVFSVPC
jgi:signal transduction histidine kinase